MIAAFARRIRLRDCAYTDTTLYMDGVPVANRAEGLSDHDWRALCLHLGKDRYEPVVATAIDHDAQARLARRAQFEAASFTRT